LTHTIGLHLAQIVVSAGVIAAGFLGHWFKGRNQWWYGFVEVIFGSASGVVVGFTMFAGQPLLTQWVTLVGCAYVISRGLNNISDSKKKKALPLPSPLETAGSKAKFHDRIVGEIATNEKPPKPESVSDYGYTAFEI
jgi:hypothetical protein